MPRIIAGLPLNPVYGLLQRIYASKQMKKIQGERSRTPQLARHEGSAAASWGAQSPPRVSSLTKKLAARTSLSAAELAVLDTLSGETRAISANRDIITEGYKYNELFVLLDGIAIRYRVLHDGRRQILNVALPGDFLGFPACFFETAAYSTGALTEVAVSAIPFQLLFQLFADHPRIGAAIFWIFSCEATMYAERLIDIGRRSAIERVGHFLLELLIRLQVIGLADERSFRLSLTQELIADVLGLTSVHVSRTLRQLRADGFVAMDGQQVTITDIEGLSALTDFGRTYLEHFRMNDALFPDNGRRRGRQKQLPT